MIKVGITGQSGFLGYHLYNTLSLHEEIALIEFRKEYFACAEKLELFVSSCDVIVHLAGLNRHHDSEVILKTNPELALKITEACEKTGHTPHIIYSSSTQESKDNPYGISKKKAEELLKNWAIRHGAGFTSLVIPNIFGPFGKPEYNSFIATFCHKLIHGETPEIIQDANVDLIYVQDLVEEIKSCVLSENLKFQKLRIKPRYTKKVSQVLGLLKHFRSEYFDQGKIPAMENDFEQKLLLTFRCFVPDDYFPKEFKLHTDDRGSFVEIVRAGSGGQFSYSTTRPDITRGNHFHTRKFERFAVIKGKALIQLRKKGSEKIINYKLDGDAPAYVDMPVWYTHNIKNIGETELLTLFWINEPYRAEDPDTYYETV